MTSRSVYRFILRLHPACFRKQYQEQMLWIFDESVQSRGAVSLLFDAFVSLARQWLLRSGYWRNGVRPGLSADGAVALAEVLRHNSEVLHRRSQRLYFLWVVASIIVFLVCPSPLLSKIEWVIWINLYAQIISNDKKRRLKISDEPAEFLVSLDLRKSNTPMIDGRRASLRVKYSSGIPKSGRFLLALFLLNINLLLRRFVPPLGGHPAAVIDRMELMEYLAGLVVLFASWFLLRKMRDRAVTAIQQEIDAVGSAPNLQSS